MALKTVFFVAITTARLVFPGVAPTFGTPEPNDALAPTAASRSITMDLYCDRELPGNAKVIVDVPEGLKVGKSVKLTVDLSPTPSSGTAPAKPNDSAPKVRRYAYWGCGEAIAPGQPTDCDSAGAVTADTLPEKGYAFWPGFEDKPIAGDAKAAGDYKLNSEQCGGTALTLEKDQDFLAGLELIDLPQQIDLAKSISVKWKPIPNAVAYYVAAYGGSSEFSISWSSSSKPGATEGLDQRPLSEAEIKTMIEQSTLIPPTVTSCAIPAGIFKSSRGAMLMVTALGRDKSQTADGIDARVVIRSTLSVPLALTPQ